MSLFISSVDKIRYAVSFSNSGVSFPKRGRFAKYVLKTGIAFFLKDISKVLMTLT